jgi:hypothetical protein
MERYEDYVLEQVRMGATITGLYPLTNPETRKRYEDWLAQDGIAQGSTAE